MRRRGRWLVWLSAALALATCSPRATFRLPAVPAAPADAGPFVWCELATAEPEREMRLYRDLFGWRFEEAPDVGSEYWTVVARGARIGGVVRVEPEEAASAEAEESGATPPAAWLCTLSVADVDGAVRELLGAGGMLHFGPLDVAERGRLAIASDPEGALLALLEAEGSRGGKADRAAVGREVAPRETRSRGWRWYELWVEHPERAAAFYGRLTGLAVERIERAPGGPYFVLVSDGRARLGVRAIPVRDVEPSWVPYAGVADLDAVVARARELGFAVFARDAHAAVLIDPLGAALGVQEVG